MTPLTRLLQQMHAQAALAALPKPMPVRFYVERGGVRLWWTGATWGGEAAALVYDFRGGVPRFAALMEGDGPVTVVVAP